MSVKTLNEEEPVGSKMYFTTEMMMLSVIYQNSSRIYMHGLSDFECLTSVSR